MDNPLTPKKIQRLMYLAEDKSFTAPKFVLRDDTVSGTQQSSIAQSVPEKSSTNYESSSGILDLEQCEGFGDSVLGNISLSKSTAFQPGEMTGRSTGTDETPCKEQLGNYTEFGRFSVNSIDNLTKKMNQQSSDIKEIMRQSIASAYSFHSKRDLTADEMSLVMREAPLPVNPNQINMNLGESIAMEDPVEMSIGSYFQTRCSEFNKMLPRNDSPKYDVSYRASTQLDDSSIFVVESNQGEKLDSSLDSIPVKQPKTAPKVANVTTTLSYVPASPMPTPKEKSAPVMGPPASKPKTNPEQVLTANNPIMMKSSVLLDPSRQHLYASLRQATEESNRSEDCETSLSISKIANILGNESNVSVSDMLKHIKGQKRAEPKQPLSEIDMNIEEPRRVQPEIPVTMLKESKKYDTASSAGTVNTVIDLNKMTISDQENDGRIPSVYVSRYSLDKEHRNMDLESNRLEVTTSRSKSPSSKSQSTLSTVQENLGSNSFKSTDSPLHQSKGEAKPSNIPSPNMQYTELDKSVDWQDVMRSKGRYKQGLTKVSEQWAEVSVGSFEGFVGTSANAVIALKSLTDSWLTAAVVFKNMEERDIIIDLPRFPVLITPAKTEKFNIQLTCNTEMRTDLPFTVVLKDSAMDAEVSIPSSLSVDVKMPTLQAISSVGVNKVVFPPIQEGTSSNKAFVLISDCPVDLQLDLSVFEGSNIFSITSVQEISKTDVTKKLLDTPEETCRPKQKGVSKQLCRLSSNSAIKVTITFTPPKLSELQLVEKIATFKGSLNVNLIGVNTLLKRVELIATAGTAHLVINLPTNKLHLTGNELTSIPVTNAGSVRGTWCLRLQTSTGTERGNFKLYSSKLEVDAGATVRPKVAYSGPADRVETATLIFEDTTGINRISLELTAGCELPKVFPIKTNYATMSWVRAGRKEISLKNCTDKRVHLKCRIVGEGFTIDLPRTSGHNFFLTFGPCECRPLPILYNPNSVLPAVAVFYMVFETGVEITRKVMLHGSGGGEPLRWSGLVTYGDTALVRALPRRPVELTLVNKSSAPAFLAATVHFNLQYLSVGDTSSIESPRRIVPARGSARVVLQVDWARAERRSRGGGGATLASLTLLAGPEAVRRRILRVIRNEGEGSLEVSRLPQRLRQLAGHFEGEDPTYDDLLKDFQENKSSLDELVNGVVEMTAQVDVCQEFSEDRTILITDDTVLDHHTLCD